MTVVTTPSSRHTWWKILGKAEVTGLLTLLGVIVAAIPLLLPLFSGPGSGPGSTVEPFTGTAGAEAPHSPAPPASAVATPAPSPAPSPTRAGRAPTPATADPRPPSAAATSPAVARSAVPLSGPLNGAGSSYLNLDVVPVAVTTAAGSERAPDLQVEPTQLTPMNNTSLGVPDGRGQCVDMHEGPPARPLTPEGFCGRTRAGRSFSITVVPGDGTELQAAVYFP